MKFNIDNHSAPDSASPMVLKCSQLLRKLPDGELKTSRGLASLAGMKSRAIERMGFDLPQELTVKDSGKRLYGNPKTIAAWKNRKVQD